MKTVSLNLSVGVDRMKVLADWFIENRVPLLLIQHRVFTGNATKASYTLYRGTRHFAAMHYGTWSSNLTNDFVIRECDYAMVRLAFPNEIMGQYPGRNR